MGLQITNCIATPKSLIIFFSAPVDKDSIETANFDIHEIGATPSLSIGTRVRSDDRLSVTISLGDASLDTGVWLSIFVQGVSVDGNRKDTLPDDPGASNTFATQVNGDSTAVVEEARAVEDAVSFPVLTEEVRFAPSPMARISPNLPAAPGAAPLGQIVTNALNDVLGWKTKPGDAKGFVGALNASFVCSDMEGRTECKWTPRSYTVQTDLSGGITGAQASIYSRAKTALDQALPLLDGLSALDPEAATEDVTALKAIARGQLTELVKELGQLGGPRVSRVNQYFGLLIGSTSSSPVGVFPDPPVVGSKLSYTDPDIIEGTLGNLRDELGLNFTTQDFVNSVTDEEDLSNYRILSDYVTSLAQSWLDNLPFFGLNGGSQKKFFGTQLVLLSRQLSVVAESVDEVRFTLDSVFIGPAERQTLLLNFDSDDPSIFVEDLLTWIQGFASDEGPRLIQDGGKFGVQNTFLPIARQLQRLVNDVLDSNATNNGLPAGFRTARVKRSLQELDLELNELVTLAQPISHVVTPLPDFGLPPSITAVDPTVVSVNTSIPQLTIYGTGFEPSSKIVLRMPTSAGKRQVFATTTRIVTPQIALAQFKTTDFKDANGKPCDVEVVVPGHSPAILRDGLALAD